MKPKKVSLSTIISIVFKYDPGKQQLWLSQHLHLKLQHNICANNFHDHFCELTSKEPQLYSSKETVTDCQITA